MTTTPIAKRTSRFYRNKSGDGIRAFPVEIPPHLVRRPIAVCRSEKCLPAVCSGEMFRKRCGISFTQRTQRSQSGVPRCSVFFRVVFRELAGNTIFTLLRPSASLRSHRGDLCARCVTQHLPIHPLESARSLGNQPQPRSDRSGDSVVQAGGDKGVCNLAGFHLLPAKIRGSGATSGIFSKGR